MWAGRVRDRPIVDKPAAVAKAPFCKEAERFQRVGTRVVTKRNLLTLAKDSMAGIISDIVVLVGETSGGWLHDGGRWLTRVNWSSIRLRSLRLSLLCIRHPL